MLSVFGLRLRVFSGPRKRARGTGLASGSFSLSRTFVVLVLRYGCGLHMLSWAIVRRLFVPAGPVSRSGRKSRLIEGGLRLPSRLFVRRESSIFLGLLSNYVEDKSGIERGSRLPSANTAQRVGCNLFFFGYLCGFTCEADLLDTP